MHQRFRVLRRFVSTIAIAATVVMPYAALVPVAHAANLFSDGFESGSFSSWTVANGNWTNLNGPAANSGTRRAGVQGDTSVPDPADDVLGVSISTLGYDNVVLNYAARIADNLEPGQGDRVSVEWSVGGAPWFTVRNFTGVAGGWVAYADSLPAGAANQSDLRIRFRAQLNAASDKFFLDDVSLDGDSMDTTAPVVEITSPVDSEVTGPTGNIVYSTDDSVSASCVLDTFPVLCDPAGPYVFLLADGQHTFSVTGTDAAGNEATDAVTWTVSTPATTGTVIVNKTVAGETAAVESFQLFLTNTVTDELTVVTSGVPQEYAPGTYQFSEAEGLEDETYEASYGLGCPDGLVTVVAGVTTTCDVTNTLATPPPPPTECPPGTTGIYPACDPIPCPPGTIGAFPACIPVLTPTPIPSESPSATPATITVVKETEDGDGRFEFTVTDSYENQQSGTVTTEEGEGEVSFEVFPNAEGSTYSVQEVVPNGWNLDDAYCEYDGEEAGISIDLGEEVTLDPGDEVTCYFEDTYLSPSEGDALVRVVKLTEGGDATFTFSGPGDEPFSLETSDGYAERFFYFSVDSETGTPVAISEDALEGWDLSDLSCYFSEQGPRPEVTPSSTPTPSPSVSPTATPDPEVQNIIIEEGFDYGDSSVQVTVYPQDEITCTFTNVTDEGGQEGGGGGGNNTPSKSMLIVEKVILNGEDASVSFSDFSFWLDGDLHQFEADGTNQFEIDSGEYKVTEDYTSGYTVGYSGDCDEDGNLSMLAGEAYRCVVTNTLGVGGFNPGSEVPAPTPTPTASPSPAPGGNEGNGSGSSDGSNGAGTPGTDDITGDIGGESPSPSASPSADDENLAAAAIGSLADWPVCVSGGLGWIVVNFILFLLAFLWLRRAVFGWVKVVAALAIVSAGLLWLGAECGNDPAWLPASLGLVSLFWLRLRAQSAN